MVETHDEHSQQDERAPMARPHVFVVNSVPEILDVLRELLQDERYHVTTATFAPQTFDQITALQPSLLVVDLAVSAQAGWDLLAELQGNASTRGIPVVVVSTDPHLLDRAEDAHGHRNVRGSLVKPFDLDDLLDTIQALIGPA